MQSAVMVQGACSAASAWPLRRRGGPRRGKQAILLHNLAEAVERIVGRHCADLREPLTVWGTQHDGHAFEDAAQAELDIHGRPRPLVARTREHHQQIHERIERGGSLRAIARELRLSRGTVLRFARAAGVEELLAGAVHRLSKIDDYRLYLHHRWMEGCTNAAALTREIQLLGYRGNVNTVRRHLPPYRTGAIPTDAPLPQLTVRRVTNWIMRKPYRQWVPWCCWRGPCSRRCMDDSRGGRVRRSLPRGRAGGGGSLSAARASVPVLLGVRVLDEQDVGGLLGHGAVP
ncbi:hypothetical protein [Streptomyces sp. WAC 06725]|uniref:hypothetical protein n=1 Tax=Streptomyces sp. WAC 06725 TaxID=2203209 RepID=UPI00163BAA83|nr:hypothetical protein [Streptomyces sp. WAC 06725]